MAGLQECIHGRLRGLWKELGVALLLRAGDRIYGAPPRSLGVTAGVATPGLFESLKWREVGSALIRYY